MNQRINTLAQSVGLALLTLTAGCFATSRTPSAPSASIGSIRKTDRSRNGKITSPVLEAEVMRFGDDLTAAMAQAADEFADQVGTPQARALALRLKTGMANNSMIIASGPNPTANLLDMVVLVTLWRTSLEDYWVPRYGPPAEAILGVSRRREDEIWSIAAEVLTPQQLDELRELIRTWRADHPEQLDVGVRFRDFAEIAAKESKSNGRPGSLFALFFLDPLAGLDPAVRELEQNRYLADRALYVMQRMPNLLRWQSELLFSQTLATPDLQQALSNSTRFAQSAELLSQAVQQLPGQLSAERQKVMNDFATQTPQLQALLTQLRDTLNAGNEMAVSVNTATKSLDSFVGRYDSRNATESTMASSPTATTSDTKSVTTPSPPTAKPFDVNEYGLAAVQIANAAQQLNTVLASLNKTTPEINAVVERTGLQGKELVDYTFHRALSFLAVALLGFVLAMLAYRYLAARLFRKSTNRS